MSLTACQAILVMAGLFVLLGVIFFLWNSRENKKYYNSILLTQKDVKEFMTHEPKRSWLGAWGLGGRISIIVGASLAVTGCILWLAGRCA